MVPPVVAENVLIRLLGVPEVRVDVRAGVFPSRGYCLLAMLALAPAQRMTRAQAAAQLWDDRESGGANLANLRQLLLRMQRAFPGVDLILGVDNGALWLTEKSSQIDLCSFLSLSHEPPDLSLATAISLYRGNLLQGVEAPSRALQDALLFSTDYVRERYFSIIADCLREIVRYANADISILRAAELHAFSIDSTREEIGRSFIASYGAIGRPEEARRVYETLSRALKLDGIDAPVPETRAAAVRAVARVIEAKSERRVVPGGGRYFAETVPRVALLAPRWVEAGADNTNFHRSLIEDIANELARYRTLVAIAPHSSFKVEDDGGLVARNDLLRADYSLSSLVRPGEGLGVLSVRLVDTASAAIVWASEFPLRHDRLVASSRLLIAQVAAEVSGAIESDTFRRLERTESSSSYLLFLRGQNALKTCDLRSVRRARRDYKAAINEDSRFAEAHSGLSWSLYLEWIVLGGSDPRLLADARELADNAIQHDPTSAAGYWRKAMVSLYQRDFDGSEECFRRAEELHPNSADILLDHSDALGFVGDADEAWQMFERAIELNPSPPDHYWWAGSSIAFSQADYKKALDLCGKLENEEPAMRLLAAIHGQLGNLPEARDYGQRLREAYPGQTAAEMTRLQPHRTKEHRQPFLDGLRVAGIE